MPKTPSLSQRTIITTCLLFFISYLTMKMSVPLLPQLHRIFHASSEVFKFSMSAFFFCYAISQLIWGGLASTRPHKTTMSYGLSFAVVGTFIICCSTHAWMYVLGRCLEGIGMGVCSPLNRTIIAKNCEPSQLPRAILYLAILFNVMPFISPSIGVLVASSGYWRLVFIVLLLMTLSTLLFLRSFMPSPKMPSHSLKPKHLFQRYQYVILSRSFYRFGICYICLFGLMLSLYSIMPFWLVVQLHIPKSSYTFYTLALTFSSLIGNITGRHIVKPLGVPLLLKIIILLQLFAMLIGLLLQWITGAPTIFSLLFFLSLFALITGLASIPCNTGIISSFPEHTGEASATLFMMTFLMASILTLILSNISVASFSFIILSLVPLSILCCIQLFLISYQPRLNKT